MRALNDHEKRTIRRAAVGILIYLVLFYGLRGFSKLESARSDYQKLVRDAQRIRLELQPYENKALLIEKLRQGLQMDLAKLSKATLVAETSAAIQKAAQSGGIQLGPIRESPARTSAKELTSMQLEGVGQVPAVLALLHRLETLGYPLLIDSVQITPEAAKPGMVKVSLTVIILDYDQWKNEKAPPHA